MQQKKLNNLKDIISKYPEVQGMYSTVTNSSATINVELVDKENRKDNSRDFLKRLVKICRGIPGTQVTVTAASMASGGRASKDVTFELVGENREELQNFAQKVKEELAKDPNVRDIGTNDKSGLPEITLTVDRDKAADLGVSSSDVASTLNTLFNGTTVSKYDDGTNIDNVLLYLKDDQR